MIEDESIGLKVAENEDEVFWSDVQQSAEKDIKNLDKMLKFQWAVLWLARDKLKECEQNKAA